MLVKPLFAAFACLALTACGLPRSAAFEAELLNRTSFFGGDDVPEFAVYDVDSQSLPIFAAWGEEPTEAFTWPVAQEQPESLLIAPGDSVQLTIWDAEENSIFDTAGVTAIEPTEVDPRGRIFVPFIGEMRVAGMSPSTARQRVEEELIMSVPSAQVQLFVEPGRNNTAILTTGVVGQGLVPLPQRNFSFVELFAQTGGPDPSFASPQVRLIRDGRTYGIDYEELITDPRRNIAVRGGDTIYAVDDERQFLTLGATGSQAVVDFPEPELSALEAMSLIGGVGGAANPEAVLIMREYDLHELGDGVSGPPNQRVVFRIDLTSTDGVFSARRFYLRDGDLVYGTESALGPFFTALGLGNTLTSVTN